MIILVVASLAGLGARARSLGPHRKPELDARCNFFFALKEKQRCIIEINIALGSVDEQGARACEEEADGNSAQRPSAADRAAAVPAPRPPLARRFARPSF